MTCQTSCSCRKWDLQYIKQIAPDLWPGNGPAQLGSICLCELDGAACVKSGFYTSVGFLELKIKTALIVCHLAAHNEKKLATAVYSKRSNINFVKHWRVQELSARLIKHRTSSSSRLSWNTPQVYHRWTLPWCFFQQESADERFVTSSVTSET